MRTLSRISEKAEERNKARVRRTQAANFSNSHQGRGLNVIFCIAWLVSELWVSFRSGSGSGSAAITARLGESLGRVGDNGLIYTQKQRKRQRQYERTKRGQDMKKREKKSIEGKLH